MFISLITEGGGRLFDHNVNGITLLLLHSRRMSITGFSFASIPYSNKSAWHVNCQDSVSAKFIFLSGRRLPTGALCGKLLLPHCSADECSAGECGKWDRAMRLLCRAAAHSNRRLLFSASHPAPGYLSPRRPPTVHLAGPSSLAGNVDANHFSAAEVCVPPSARDASEFQSLYVPWPHHVFDLIRMWSKIHKFCILRRCSHVGSWSHIRTHKMHRSVVSLFYYVGKTIAWSLANISCCRWTRATRFLIHPPCANTEAAWRLV